MKDNLKLASSQKVIDISKAKKFEEMSDDEQKSIVNYTVWKKILDFIEPFGEAKAITGAIIILKTDDGDVRTDASNMFADEFIETLEEVKQRHYFTKFMGDIL